MSGHNKWAQIKHKKASTDARKGKLFSKLAREIIIATRLGGSAPETNTRLRTAIERCRDAGLPKENIERAIAKGAGKIGDQCLDEFVYGATGSEGVMLVITGSTDNNNRTVAEVKHIIGKHGCAFTEPGSILWNFNKIGIAEITDERATRSRDDSELALIEAGATDLHYDDTSWIVETSFLELDTVKQRLIEKGFTVMDSYVSYRSTHPIICSDVLRVSIHKLIDALHDHDDIEDVYNNILEPTDEYVVH